MTTPFAHKHAISDVCVLVRDLEASIAFYTEKLGFTLKHRAPGFADFSGAGLTLALWERRHIGEHAHVPITPDALTSMVIAVKLASPTELDEAYAELAGRGVTFVAPPDSYPWNAYCVYFAGPDGELWELYTWLPGGAPGHQASAA